MDPINLIDLNLDWYLAMQRLSKDLRDDFWPDPLRLDDLLGRPNATLARVDPILRAYRPSKGISYGIPKKGFTVRDSIQIGGIDRLVYQALIDQLIPYIDPLLSPNVFSHRLRNATAKWMFQPSVGQWKLFRQAIKSVLLKSPASYLVVSDVARYFESISFRTLRNQLDQLLGANQSTHLRTCVKVLFVCLNGWSPYDGHGIPQNIDASSFLGNLFLDYIDKIMAKEGFCMFRYMDDLRVVVPTEAHARKAIIRLVELLRTLGLGLNTAKTKILGPESQALKDHLLPDDPEVDAIENAINEKTREGVEAIVELLFRKTTRLIDTEEVGSGIFRFCINRIANLRSFSNLDMPAGDEITDAVMRLLVRQPEETGTLCRYLELAPMSPNHVEKLEQLLVSEPLTVYPWQNFLLWRLISNRCVVTPALTNKAHALLSNEPLNPETAGAALYLGKHGDYADRRAIAGRVSVVGKGFLRRSYQVAIQELHKAERSQVYSEASHNDGEAAVLSDHLTGLSEPIYVQDAPKLSIEDLPDALPGYL